jgi:hypothetical protein
MLLWGFIRSEVNAEVRDAGSRGDIVYVEGRLRRL